MAENGGSKKWQDNIQEALKFWRKFRQTGERTEEIYRSAKGQTQFVEGQSKKAQVNFNIFYSNVNTLTPVVYNAQPKASVSRAQNEKRLSLETIETAAPEELQEIQKEVRDFESAENMAAMAIERAINHYNDLNGQDLDTIYYDIVQDYLVVGMGVPRVKLETEIQVAETEVEVQSVNEEGITVSEIEVQEVENIKDQRILTEHVYWKDFLMAPSRRWAVMPWVAYRHVLSKEEVKEMFGKKVARDIPYLLDAEGADISGTDDDKKTDTEAKGGTHAQVWEIWDKTDKKRIWIATSFDDILKEEEDPLGLSGFFPSPEPIWANKTSGSMVPIADFMYYRDQAAELNRVVSRISALIEGMRVNGTYDSRFPDLQKLGRSSDNTLIPVENYQTLTESGGVNAALQWVDVSQRGQMLAPLVEREQLLKQEIFEIIGISDIMRAAQNDPRETATAVLTKNKFGTSRVARRRADVQEQLRAVMRIEAEIIAEHFDPEILQEVSGIQITPKVEEILQRENMRKYHIDVQSDVTAQQDAEEEKESRIQFLTVATNTLNQLLPMMDAGVPPAIIEQLLKYVIRAFKASQPVEDAIEGMAQSISQLQQQAKQEAAENPKPTPEEILAQVEQAKVETERMKIESNARTETEKNQIELKKVTLQEMEAQTNAKIEAATQGAQNEAKEAEIEISAERLSLDRQIAEIESQKLVIEAENLRLKEKELDLQFELETAKLAQGVNSTGNIGEEVGDLA